MQERFDRQSAIKAIQVFEALSDDTMKEQINSSNKALLFLTALAYKGECTNYFFKKEFPINNVTPMLKDLEKWGFISGTKGFGRMITYKINMDKFNFTNELPYSVDNMYLFTNTLFNIPRYIKTYHVYSWNALALMLEVALKMSYDNTVQLNAKDIKVIKGQDAIKYEARKTLVTYGVLKPRKSGSRLKPEFSVNKRAYMLPIS